MTRYLMVLLLSLLPALAGAHAGDGRYAEVEIVDVHSGLSLPVYTHKGRRYVAGEPGREYTIRIRNRSSGRLLAVTSVDGVNVITGQTASMRQSGYVLGAWGSVGIDGWRKSLDRVARFYFTDLGDSYAARTDRPDHVGVIGVALFTEKGHRHEQPRIAEAPQAEDRAAAPGAESRRVEPQLGTGHGRSDWSQARYTGFERASDRPAETVTIYYDARRNLVAQGVIPRERGWGRRLPEPFPSGFAPDPRR